MPSSVGWPRLLSCLTEVARAVDDALDVLVAGGLAALDAHGLGRGDLGELTLARHLQVLGRTLEEAGALGPVAAVDLGPGPLLQAVYGDVAERLGHARVD